MHRKVIREYYWLKRARKCSIAICLCYATSCGTILPLAAWGSPLITTKNVAATSALVEAQYQFTRSITAHLASGLLSEDMLVDRVRHHCPDVGAGAPPSARMEAQKFVQEMGGALLVTLLHKDRYAILRLVHTITPLHWSMGKINNIVKSEAVKLRKLSSLTIPDLCGNARSWSASHLR